MSKEENTPKLKEEEKEDNEPKEPKKKLNQFY